MPGDDQPQTDHADGRDAASAGADASADAVPEGIDAAHVTAWFEEHVPGVAPPLTFRLIAGGHSNLTFRVDDADGRSWVLRRPPLGQVLATAHDMAREHRIISALAPTDIPVAPTVGLCEDTDVNGAPFYVMDFVEGLVVRDAAGADALGLDARRRASESLIDVLAAIHAVDVDAVGLGDLGRREGYIERQLTRWYGQLQKSRTREVPVLDEVHRTLSASVPDQGPAAIAHGDYRLDNCMLAPDGSVRAVLDWELCTLGDPLADLGLLWVYWGAADEPPATLAPAATTLDGFLDRRTLADRYAAASGRDISDLPFYVAFGYWKLACIIDGVYARYVGGSMGTKGDASAFEPFADAVDRLGESALRMAGELS